MTYFKQLQGLSFTYELVNLQSFWSVSISQVQMSNSESVSIARADISWQINYEFLSKNALLIGIAKDNPKITQGFYPSI